MPELKIISGEFRYEILHQIYLGGMGVVYEALQHGAQGFAKRVAIKVIRSQYARQPEFIANFIGEARLVSDLIHTNIVQTYHLGESGGNYFICMELIRGVNLEQFLLRLEACGRRLPVELAVFIVSRVARGLAYAHAKRDRDAQPLGIVHRDINPKNILIAFEGDVKLTDFGVAKAAGFLKDKEGEEVAGKPEYMSPEQADFRVTDRRSDLFSAGIVLSQLLAGQNIFRGQNAEESRQRVLTMPVPAFTRLMPELETRLDQILQKVLQKEPSARYQSADELLYDLEFFIYHRGYGPTNETLGKFIRDLFQEEVTGASDATRGATSRMGQPGPPVSRASSLFDRIKSHAP
ncbi:MAG: serine/threonine protein kinase [Verrucomicrobiae bacterium]|nr:serine/threonine protein kinase [Verrucomicrobiae bacterium]